MASAAEQQKDLLTGRWRKVRTRKVAEHELQIALIQHLKFRAKPGVIYFHVPNGGWRTDAEAAKFKAMGVLPGASDLVIVWNEHDRLQNLYLELKARGGRLSDEQFAFGEKVAAAGAHYRIASNIDDALLTLKNFNLLKS